MDDVRARITRTQLLLVQVVQFLYSVGAPPAVVVDPNVVRWQGAFAMACADGRVWLCADDNTEFYLNPTTSFDHTRSFALAIQRNEKRKDQTSCK